MITITETEFEKAYHANLQAGTCPDPFDSVEFILKLNESMPANSFHSLCAAVVRWNKHEADLMTLIKDELRVNGHSL